MVLKKSTAVFGAVVVALLMVCVGLLVALLKNQSQHEEKKHSTDTTASHQTSVTARPTIVTTETPDDGPWKHYRLPTNVKPLHYALKLHPDLEKDTFSGEVAIDVNVMTETEVFIVHQHWKLNVTDSKVTGSTGALAISKTTVYQPNEYFVIHMKDKVNPGRYTLHYTFHGELVGSIIGFYKSTYISKGDNTTHSLATSKFQPTYARRAFPCFDEPSFKSNFTVTLLHKPDQIALSNMPAKETIPEGKWSATLFQTSVPMVTYLACFIVCDFESKNNVTQKNVPFRVFSTPDQVEKTKFALDVGIKILNFYEDYFQIDYPLPKSDMIAIPDFSSGAMEHWGLITFRESNLLYDKKESSPQNKQRVAAVISHELAHMWFGNLVTMEWWDDLWLNEGFASYIEYKGLHEVFKHWMMMDQILTEDTQPVMRMDATTRSHPIIQPVDHPDQITEIFDAISYNKGAAVLRMLESFVKPEKFQKGVSDFLKAYKYGNAKTGQLWEKIENASERKENSIADIMDTWTRQMGFPYVTVKREKVTGKVLVKQQRFLLNPEMNYSDSESPYSYVWKIPLTFYTESGENGMVWLNSNSLVPLDIPNIKLSEWIKFNKEQAGYYIVNYSTEDWERFIKILLENSKILTPSDRSGLLFDAFQLAQAGIIGYDIPLRMTTYLTKENLLTPWETAYSSLVQIGHLYQDSNDYDKYKNFVRKLTQPMYKRLGWHEQNSHTDSLLQTTIIGLACYSGNSDCRQQAVTRLKALRDGKEASIPLALRSIVYKYAMEEDNSVELWQFMWDRYMNETSAQEKVKLLYGLAHVQNEDLIVRLLTYAMQSDKKIRDQDFFTVLSYIAGNTKGRPIVWNFLRNYWTVLVERFSINDRYLGRAVKTICDYFTTEERLQEMREFFLKYPEAGAGQRAREQAEENVANNIRWLRQNQLKVSNWLNQQTLPWSDHRLTDNIVPIDYDLTLHINVNGDEFNGKVKIEIDVLEDTKHVIVHAHNLRVSKTEVEVEGIEKPVSIIASFAFEANEFWVIEFDRNISSGYRTWLTYHFEGHLDKNLLGLYKSSYVDGEKKIRNLVTSQFQSTYARRAFPCFDEPKFKSTFSIRLIHAPEYTALSNMPTEGAPITQSDGLVETRFQKSVKMVTYLVCVIVSDFKSLQMETKRKTLVRVFARPEEYNKLQYALDTGVKTLEYFEDYFGINYPLPKLDMVAVPDFQAGAMENWGLVTYRETLLIFDENESSPYNKLRITAVIGHELAHMWFGNLVTMKWWDDLWLNEGFASYMEYKSALSVEPTWDMNAQFYLEDIYRAQLLDAVPTSHPIVQKVNHPDEISSLFDGVSYSKGASILRMLEGFLGVDTFREGVSDYLKNFTFGNAETKDLWRFLKAAALRDKKNIDVDSIMDTWTLQMGYPYVNVKKLPEVNGNQAYTLVQGRFLIDPDANVTDEASPFNYRWDIPVSYLTDVPATEQIHWMSYNQTESLLTIPANSWIKFNKDQKGFYLVNYLDDWQEIQEVLMSDHEKLSSSDRTNLISDAFLLARAGILRYDKALELTKYLSKEREFVPWETARKSLSYLLQVIKQNKHVDQELQAYMDTLSRDHLKRLGWDEISDHLERRLRETIVDISCSSGNGECLKNAAVKLSQWKGGEQIMPDLKLLVYKFGMIESGNSEMWDFMWEKYLKESSSQEKKNLLYGLASTRDVSLLRNFLKLSEDPGTVRDQDYFSVLSYVAGNPVGLPLTWNYVRDNWEELVKRFTIGDRYLGDAVKSICNHFTTIERLKEMEDFFAKYPEAGAGERSRKEALANVRNNIKWASKHQDSIHQWLQDQPKMPWHEIRLTEDVVPTHYKLKLDPDIDAGTFEGNVEISVEVKKPTKFFLVHIHMLNIRESTVTGPSGTILRIENEFSHKNNDYWVVELEEEVSIGKYVLSYDFVGSLLGGLVGFYRSSYVDSDTRETKYLATSQFQSTYARRAFPCFDEPSIKSKFTVTLVHNSTLVALSNMPVESSEEIEPGRNETTFKESKSMVTYLVCVIVCDFKYTEITTKFGVEIRVYAPPDRYEQTNFALAASKDILEYFEDYFDIRYPLPKLDMIALPDFRAGAMENWGLITYREIYLLYDKQETSPNVEFSIVMIIAHEIAHMWFGNLVTMKWWDDLWLNEGFATHMAYKCVNDIRPDMGAEGLFLMGELSGVLEPDATRSSHPIIQPVKHPDEISAIFDSISYGKGASVLRKLEAFLTPDIFKEGIRKYLRKFEYQNARTDDLWEELAAASMNTDVKPIMDTWTKQMGYPTVNAMLDPSSESVHLLQNRFLLNSDVTVSDPKNHSPYNYVWRVPIHAKSDKIEFLIWLNDPKATVNISKHDLPENSLVKWNAGHSGFYLVNYEGNIWDRWSQSLLDKMNSLRPLDRSNLLSDAFLLAKASDLTYDKALDLTKYLKNEDHLVPWSMAKSGLLFVAQLMQGDSSYSKMQTYLQNISEKKFAELGWSDDPDQKYHDRRLRAGIADLACRAENPKCLTDAAIKLAAFLEGEKIPAALRSLVYRYGLWSNNSLWNDLWDHYRTENTAQGRRDLLYGLAYTQDEEQLKNYLSLAKDEKNVRAQDFSSVITNVANNPRGLQIAWDFLVKEWQFLVDRYTINDKTLGDMTASITSHFSTVERLKEMQKFYADTPDAGAGEAARQESLEIVSNNIDWKRSNLPMVKKWLENYKEL